MIARLIRVTLWLLLGHAVLAGLYWGLLNVPESNVIMLAGSALIFIALIAVAAIVEGTAIRQLALDEPLQRGAWFALASLPSFVVALAIRLGFNWIYSWLHTSHEAHSGEIDAWLIAHFAWTRTALLHRAIGLALDFLRDVIGTSLAVGAYAAGVLGGFNEVLRLRWVQRAFARVRLAIITVAVVALIWLPWRAAWWRPASLPDTAVQPMFAGAKLLVIVVIAHVGWALILWSAVRDRPGRR